LAGVEPGPDEREATGEALARAAALLGPGDAPGGVAAPHPRPTTPTARITAPTETTWRRFTGPMMPWVAQIGAEPGSQNEPLTS
jgi:hypothetical protein